MRSILGSVAMVGCLGLVIGCVTPPPPKALATKPGATARAESSAITKKMSGVSKWRIYEGRTNVVVMGFGKDGKPVNGMRIRYASPVKRKWALSIEMVKGKGALQIDRKGNVIRDSFVPNEVKFLFGATRVFEKWAEKQAVRSKTVAYSSGTECATSAKGAYDDCAPVVKKCVGEVARGMRSGRIGGGAGMAAGALLRGGRCVWENRGAVTKCGSSAYEAFGACKDALTDGDKKEEEKSPPPEDKKEPEPAKDPAKEPEPDPTKDLENPPSDPAKEPEPDPTRDLENPDPQADAPKDNENPPAFDPNEAEEPGEPQSDAPGPPNGPVEGDPFPTPEEREEDRVAASEDPESAPVEEQVAEQDASPNDNVDPDPPEAQAEAAAEPNPEPEPEPEPDPTRDLENPTFDEDTPIASFFGLGSAQLGTRAVSSSRRGRSSACGPTRVLVCGAIRVASFCRCVTK